MANLEFKIIEQANEIADGDYILTVHDGEIKKVAKSDAKVGSDGGGGCLIIPYYKYTQEIIYDEYNNSMQSILYKIGFINNTNYIIVKDSEWRMIKGGSPVCIKYNDNPSFDGYSQAISIDIAPNMFNGMGSNIDYDGKSTSMATLYWMYGTINSDGTKVPSVSPMYVISATTFRNYINYNGGKPPYDTYEGGEEKALEVLEELGYFDVN